MLSEYFRSKCNFRVLWWRHHISVLMHPTNAGLSRGNHPLILQQGITFWGKALSLSLLWRSEGHYTCMIVYLPVRLCGAIHILLLKNQFPDLHVAPWTRQSASSHLYVHVYILVLNSPFIFVLLNKIYLAILFILLITLNLVYKAYV